MDVRVEKVLLTQRMRGLWISLNWQVYVVPRSIDSKTIFLHRREFLRREFLVWKTVIKVRQETSPGIPGFYESSNSAPS